jgi:CRISPR-associated protein Csd1
MILQALKEYGDYVKPPPVEGIVSDAFADGVRIQWLLEIDADGNFHDLRSRGVEKLGEKKNKIISFPALDKVPKNVTSDRSHGGNPQFLADNLEYWFGISAKKFGQKSLDSHIALAKELADRFPDDLRAQAVKKFFEKLVAGQVLAQRRGRAIDRVQSFFAAQPPNEVIVDRRQRVIRQVEQYFDKQLTDKIQVAWNPKPARGAGKLMIMAKSFPVKNAKERIALCLQQDNLQPVFHACENLRLFWSSQYQAANAKREKPAEAGGNPPCLCCGQAKPAVEPFGTFSGLADQATSLVFTGKPAYQSYGFKKGEIPNAAVCLECSQAVIRGLESLLKSRSTSKKFHLGRPRPGEGEKIPPVVFVFWARQPTEFDFGRTVEADLETVKRILESVHKGIPREIAEKHFYILGMSESYRRTMVRYWSETNVKEVVENLAAWFEDLRDRFAEYGSNYKPLSIIRLCQMTVRQPGQPSDDWKIPPPVSTGLFLSAFLRKPVPPPVLQMLVNRVRIIPQTDFEKEKPNADYKLKPARMALLRLTLNRLMKNNEQPFDVGLDVDRREPEYHCGRLLAVCDAAMRWSNSRERGRPGTSTVVDRYMGSASSAPCSVLPVVYRNSRHHLNKLKRDLPAKFLQMEKLLDEILSKLKSYPVTLTPKEAGVFILGFHHQRQYFFLVSRYAKLKKQRDEGELPGENKKELEALEDFVNRARFDVSLLADLPDEEAPEAPAAEAE